MSKERHGWWSIEFAGAEPDDVTLEYIAELVKQGYTSGQILIEEEDEEAS